MELGNYVEVTYLDELLTLVNDDELKLALSEKNSNDRAGRLQDIMREAVGNSSAGYYNGEIYYFGGQKYEKLERGAFGDIVYEFGKKLGMPEGDYGKLERIIKVCERKLWSKHLKQNKECVVFSNCVIDTRTGEASDFSRDFVVMNALDYPYKRYARGYMWHNFLDQVLPHRVYQKILQEFLGSLFVSRRRAKMETLMILKGDGSNGKGVIFETIVGVLGKDSVSTFGLDELICSSSERKRNLATINGKRLNFCSDAKKYVIDGESGTLKALISGEPMEARPLYGGNFTADELPQIMMACNQLPQIKDWGYGMKRRLCIIPFDVQIPKHRQNKSLADELRAEYPYIFNWIMEGKARFIEQGYKLSESELQNAILAEYEVECNVALKYMQMQGYLSNFDMVADAQPVWIQAKKLYREFVRWCDHYCEMIVPIRQFNSLLDSGGFNRRRTGGGIEYAVFGKKVIELLRKERKDADIDMRRERIKQDPFKGNDAITDEQRKQLEQEMGSVIAYGDKELATYLSVTSGAIRHWLEHNKLEGCYRLYNNHRVYSLDMVDKVFLPDWRGTYIAMMDARKEKNRQAIAEKDYEFHDLI